MCPEHLFGPVQSRRLGRSLGIDLVPVRTCTYNCIYCEYGTIPLLCTERKKFYPEKEVLSELEEYLSRSPPVDHLTFSGPGEPTLSLSIGRVIRFLKYRFSQYRVAVLTNGYLLFNPAVRRDLMGADVVLPTLSSVHEETFHRIHRPSSGISLKVILEGLVQFRHEYRGEIWLEIFIIPGINTTDSEINGIRDILPAIRPDRVQLNTLDRPGTEEWVRAADARELQRIATILDYPNIDNLALPSSR